MTARRVLVISDVSPLSIEGGSERVLREHAQRLAARGHQVRVLSRAPDHGAVAVARAHGMEVHHFHPDGRSHVRFFVSAMSRARGTAGRMLREAPADVLDVHQPLAGYGALTAREARGLPALYTFHSAAPLEYRSRVRMSHHHRAGATGAVGTALLWLVERACLRRADRIRVLSDFSATQLWQLYRIPSDRIVKIPGGVDVEQFRPAPDRCAVRKELGLPVDRPILLTVRNLEARMGLDVLIRAMARLVRERPDALLLVGGSGSRRAELETLVAALGLASSVRFLGFVPEADLPRHYQAADVFVLPTRALEGFGLVTVEALACGTPVLGTAVGATPEILTPLDPGFVFEDVTPGAMATRLAAFLAAHERDPGAGTRLRAACREYAESRYGWDVSVGAVERELDALVRRERPASPPGPCAVCGSALASSSLVYRGHRYLRCPRCRTRVTADMPADASLCAQYEGDYVRQFPPEQTTGSRQAMIASLLARARRHAGGDRLLDVGCAGGHLLVAAGAYGWRSTGSDVSLAACRAAGRVSPGRVVQAEAGALPFRDGAFDVVTAVNVLDHTRRPLATLAEAGRVLRAGGVAVVRIPNGALHAASAQVLGRLGPVARRQGWDHCPILHLFAFAPAALRRLTRLAALEPIAMTSSPPASEHLAGFGDGVMTAVLRRIAFGTAVALERLSRGRWLVGPSLELYARKPQ